MYHPTSITTLKNPQHRVLKLLLLLSVSLATANAQAPQISYMLPDIGTTRYSTYIEIIGPASRAGNFHTDGLYLNNDGDAVRVRCARPSDTLVVKIGPVSVSWNGRLISTTIHVLPTVIPDRTDWRDVSPEFRIPLVVETPTGVSAADTFYIVRPYAFGDRRSSAERKLGEGGLGMRSRRGAMIVDSAILADGRYEISTADCDPFTVGNQGFLPFTMISLGRIIGGPLSTNIHGDALGPDGGPGGGGGGGGYANAELLSSGSRRGNDGGSGFTGGGPGGFNNNSNPLTGSSSKRRPGTGSGEVLPENNQNATGSRSLNGLAGGESHVGLYESAGGGTGHPFGISGDGCNVGNRCDPVGGYGGGSGARDSQRGGAGGYGSAGESELGRSNGGRVVGNACLVPLAGGSGGASGNPGTFANASSSGGGGGGAIAIHALQLDNVDVWAQGHYTSRLDAEAGAGSGGGVVMGSRLVVPRAIGAHPNPLDSPRMLRGGAGRKRYDVRNLPPFPDAYSGPVMDTLTGSLRRLTLEGSGSGVPIMIYYKPERGPWRLGAQVTEYQGTTWTTTFDLEGSDTLYFVAAAQVIPNPMKDPVTHRYTSEPEQVFSQSAINIVRIFGPPVFDAPFTVDLDTFRCMNSAFLDTIWIRNKGESPLHIDQPTMAGDPGFTVISPTVWPRTVAAFDSIPLIVDFFPIAGQTGPASISLTFSNNDTSKARNPFVMTIKVNVQRIELSYAYRGLRGDTIRVGNRCLGQPFTEDVSILNIGTLPVTINSVLSLNQGLLVAAGNLPHTMPVNTARNISITYTARQLGLAVIPVLVFTADCPVPDTIYLGINGVEAALEVAGNRQFGNVALGAVSRTMVDVRNSGADTIVVGIMPAVASPFFVVGVEPPLPARLAKGQVLRITFEYRPTVEGEHSTLLRIRGNIPEGGCPAETLIVLAGKGVKPSIVPSPASISLVATIPCTPPSASFEITNTGGAPVTVYFPAFVNGPDANRFTIIRQPTQDFDLAPGESATYEIQYSPSAVNGVHSATVNIRTSDVAIPYVDIPIAGMQNTAILLAPAFINIGNTRIFSATSRVVSVTNTGSVDVTVTAVNSSQLAFSVNPQSALISAGGSEDFTVVFQPDSEGRHSGVLTFRYETVCKDSIVVYVEGTGTSGIIHAPTAVSFGTLIHCQTADDTVTYTNGTGSAVKVKGAVISGPDASHFTILNAAAATTAIQPYGTLSLYIRFNPQRGVDGRLNAYLELQADVNGSPSRIVTELIGERRSPFPATSGSVPFGAVDIGASSRQEISIKNMDAGPMLITSVSLLHGTVFSLQHPPIPVTLQPDQAYTIGVLFSPTQERDYTDSIIIKFTGGCDDELLIPLRGLGHLNVQVSLRLPRLEGIHPAARNVSIPLVGTIIVGADQIADAVLTFSFTYNSSLLHVREINPGTIVRNEVVGGMTVIEATIPNVQLALNESVIAELHGDATLGNTDSTSLRFVDAELRVPGITPTVRRVDGYLTLNICKEGGDRLLERRGSLSVTITPNPVFDDIEAFVSTYEAGGHTLSIIDTEGRQYQRIVWNAGTDTVEKRIAIPIRGMASGVYTVLLISPTRSRTYPLHIVR